MAEEKLRNAPALQCMETQPKAVEAHNDSSSQTICTANTATNVDMLNLVDDQGFTQKDIIMPVPLIPDEMLLPKHSERNDHVMTSEKSQTENRFMKEVDTSDNDQEDYCGLLHFRKWWERTEVDISVFGERITGIPIFIEENTLRVINDNYSYFIPLGKVDYIRTTDGLRSSFCLPGNKSTKD